MTTRKRLSKEEMSKILDLHTSNVGISAIEREVQRSPRTIYNFLDKHKNCAKKKLEDEIVQIATGDEWVPVSMIASLTNVSVRTVNRILKRNDLLLKNKIIHFTYRDKTYLIKSFDCNKTRRPFSLPAGNLQKGWILFITFVGKEVEEEEFRQKFSEYGDIKNMNLICDGVLLTDFNYNDTFFKACALVEYETENQALAAYNDSINIIIGHRRIKVHWCIGFIEEEVEGQGVVAYKKSDMTKESKPIQEEMAESE